MTEQKKTASEQLAELEKQQADIVSKRDALLAAARDEDLATAKTLIERHGFTSRELQPELKVRGAAASKPAAKKAAAKKAKAK